MTFMKFLTGKTSLSIGNYIFGLFLCKERLAREIELCVSSLSQRPHEFVIFVL